MTKGRKTTTIGLRLPDDFLEKLEPKAQAKGQSVTVYLKDFVLREALRDHHKKPLTKVELKALREVPFIDTLERGLADAKKGKVSKVDLNDL